jgi:hypothetical protein
MNKIGLLNSHTVYYSKPNDIDFDVLNRNWILFCMSDEKIATDHFLKFATECINQGLLEFISHGKNASTLHNLFDESLVNMAQITDDSILHVCTRGDNETALENAFWECFYATALPSSCDPKNLKVLCVDFDHAIHENELKKLLERFQSGYLPSDD